MKPFITSINLEALKKQLQAIADAYAEKENWQAAMAIIQAIGLIYDHQSFLD